MINYPRSTFTWKSHPWTPDPYYKWSGGFVGIPGQVYHVRFNLEASCVVRHLDSGTEAALFLGAPCRSEYTIAHTNLFQVPSAEWRMAFSRTSSLYLATQPSWENEAAQTRPLSEGYEDHTIDIRQYSPVSPLTSVEQVIEASLANQVMNGRSSYRDVDKGFEVEVEYPVNLINFNVADGEFQICTGPVLLPDLATWNGQEVQRVFLAHVAITRFDAVEFILQRQVEAAAHERAWLDQPRGLDRLELIDPDKVPPGGLAGRPKLTAYNEVWELEGENVVLLAEGA